MHAHRKDPLRPDYRLIVVFLVAASGLLISAQSFAATLQNSHEQSARKELLRTLIAKARKTRLAMKPGWLRLGHWRRTILGNYVSEIDGESFFLMPNGKTNPSGELAATIRALITPASKSLYKASTKTESGRSAHAICRFPARLGFLLKHMPQLATQMPQARCPAFERYWRKLSPKQISVVFSGYYLNNPSSAFGHTFLRISQKRKGVSKKNAELLDYGVSFSADVDSTNALAYAFKGLGGLFPGTFKLQPYYYKVREYNDYESRDLWEYQLKLSPYDVAMVVSHLWELGETHFDYYYLGENCSYQVLAVLESALPKFDLLAKMDSPILPADTIKALYTVPNLVGALRFRPSLRRVFRQRVADFSRSENNAVNRLVADPSAKYLLRFSTTTRIRILDAALDLADIRFAKDLIHKRNPAAARTKQQLLRLRAQVRHPSPPLEPKLPRMAMPHLGHGSRRIALGAGWSRHTGPFQRINFRLALHDLADPAAGYPDAAEIEFFRIGLRYQHRKKSLFFEDFSLVRVFSLAPIDRFEIQPAWRIDAGALTIKDQGCKASCIAASLALAGGGALSFYDSRLLVYVLAETQIRSAPNLEGIEGIPLRVGLGPSGGLRLRWTQSMISVFSAEWHWMPFQNPQTLWQATKTLRWSYLPDQALDFRVRTTASDTELMLTLMVYL